MSNPMKSSRRQSILRSLENGRRRKSFLKGTKRRLHAEKLESRELLAGDILHNFDDPYDTDRDGHFAPVDILHVINQINEPTSAASGEGPGSGSVTFFNDVNGDGYVSPIDALHAINEYNARSAEGAGEDLVRIRVQAVALDKDANGLDVPITTIAKGTDYYLKVTVQDLRLGTPPAGSPNGIYAAYLDVLYPKLKTNVEIEEIQQITFGNNPGSGNFKITFDPDGSSGPLAPLTTANITYTLGGANPENTIAANMQAALDTTFGKNNMLVTPVSAGDTNRYYVRFQGKFGDQDVDMMSVNVANLVAQFPPPNPTATVTEYQKGVYSLQAFQRAFRFSPQYDQPAGNGTTSGANDGQVTPSVDPNRLDETGNFAVGTATLGSAIRELYRVRMNTLDAGSVTLDGSVDNMVTPNHDTLIFGGGTNPDGTPTRDVVAPSEIDLIDAAPFTITEPFSANNDSFTFTETASPTAQSLTSTATGGKNVKANDTPAGLSGITLTKIHGGTAPVNLSIGTVTLASGNITFTPLANVNGTATFTYTLANAAGITDTATVTLAITAVNNAPVNSVPGTQTLAENTAATPTSNVFSSGNGNAISIADIDAGETAGATLKVDLSVTHGTLALGSIPGSPNFTFVSGGNNTSAMVIQGSLSDLNAALTNLTYTPTLNYNGSDSLRIITNDNGNTGGPVSGLSDTDTVAISVTAVNDAPVLTVATVTQNTTETFDLTFNAANSNQISVADVDVGEAGSTIAAPNKNQMKVTLTVTGTGVNTPGTLTLGSTANITILAGANNTSSVSIRGSLADVNNAINNLVLHTVVGGAGAQTLTVTADDLGNSGAGVSVPDTEVVNINVIPLTRPYAFPDGKTVVESSIDNPIDVLTNDMIDDDATGKVLLSVGTPDFGSASANGNLASYTPPADFWGTAKFTYVMNETGHAGSLDSTGTVTVTVTNVQDNPVAAPDNGIVVDEDTSTDIAVLSNDTDADDINNAGFVSTLTPVIVSGPANGTATVLANGKIRYTAGAGGHQNYNGPDSFTYKVLDETNRESGTVTVSITVNPVNDAPVAVADSYTTTGNRPIEDTLFSTTSLTGVRSNDSDVEDSQSSLVVNTTPVVAPAHALSFTLNADGSFSYQAAANYNGPDSFVYQLSDTQGGTATATVSLTIEADNDAPVANADSYLVEEDTLLNANVAVLGDARATVRMNDSDVDNALNTLTVSLVSGMGPTHALTSGPNAFVLNADGSFKYQATLDYQGSDSFVYRVTDAGGLSSTATVSITVTEKNDPPVAANDSYQAVEDVQLNISTAAGVRDGLGLDDDPDSNNPNSSLKVVLVSGPSHASVFSLNGNDGDTTDDGAFSYKAAADYNGTDSFTYKLVDPFGVSSNTATVSITISGTNDPPTAVDDGSVGTPLTLIKYTTANPEFANQEVDVLHNDSAVPDYYLTNPPPGFDNSNVETLSVASVGGVAAGDINPSNGTAAPSGDGKKVIYSPNLDFVGTDEFTYYVSDNNGGLARAHVYVNVVNFITTEITGKVFVDTNNNGVQDGTEKALAGVKITLQGHDDIFHFDYGADTDNNTANDVPALVAITDVDGNYFFKAPGLSAQQQGMRPGSYTILEEQPAFMRDGKDHAGNGATLVYGSDERFGDMISMTLPLLGVPPNLQGRRVIEENNFAERGLDSNSVSINDILASSNGEGLMFAMNGSTQIWSAKLGLNWTNLDHVTIVYNNPNSITFTFFDRAGSAGQVRTLSQTGSSSYYNGARFHFLGTSGSSNTLLQLDATAADLGLNLLAAGGNGQQPEGEADGDAGYARSVDELMAAVGNA